MQNRNRRGGLREGHKRQREAKLTNEPPPQAGITSRTECELTAHGDLGEKEQPKWI